MDQQSHAHRVSPALKRLRTAAADLHERLENRVDAISRLSDDASRADLVRRYAALHIPAEAVLADELEMVPDLDFSTRRRAPQLSGGAGRAMPAFPAPVSRSEALGMLYVLEGSSLGGRIILRELAGRGVVSPELAFLDPYGKLTGERWRAFLSVLDREIGDDETRLTEAARGARRAFHHAEMILCGDAV